MRKEITILLILDKSVENFSWLCISLDTIVQISIVNILYPLYYFDIWKKIIK